MGVWCPWGVVVLLARLLVPVPKASIRTLSDPR